MKSAYAHGVETFKEDVILSYFFSTSGTRLHRSAEGMYRSLLCQLLEEYPQLSASLQKSRLLTNESHTIWHKARLEALLREAVLALRPQRLTFYIDALDECQAADFQDLIDFLEALRRQVKKSGMELFVLISSRHYPRVTCEGLQQITLEYERGHKADISLYICCRLRLGDSSKANRIRETIQQRASGIFLWVVLIIRILNEDKSRGKVHLLEEHLDALPEDLHHLFGSVLNGTDDNSVLLLTFQWLLFADRPLRLEELYFGVIASDSLDNIQHWTREEVDVADMKNFLLNTSNGLVEVTDETVPTVQFIHGTVHDYLINTWLPSQYGQPMAVSAGLCHDHLWKCCRNYGVRSSPVLLPTPNDGVRKGMSRCFRMAADSRSRINESHQFMIYALHGIVTHANTSQSLGVQQQGFIRDFPLDTWVRLHNILVVDPADRMSEKTTLEYIFVIENALALVEVLINQKSELMSTQCDTKGQRYQSLLGAAVAKGYNDMAAFLLKNGADPNSQVNGSFKCLDTAVMQGNAGIVRKLLESGVAVRESVSDLQDLQPSPLHRAAESGRTEIVRILLAHPTYAAQWHPDMDCVLEAAIYRHDCGMIQLLNERMRPVKRMIVRALYAAQDHYAGRADWKSGTFKALHSFRLYYQTRERREPVLDRICKAHEDYLHGSVRASDIFVGSSSTAAMGTVNLVQTLLKSQTSQIPTSMQHGHFQIVLDGSLGRLHFTETIFVFEWENLIDHINRVYRTLQILEFVEPRYHDAHDDERAAEWSLHEYDNPIRPASYMVVTKFDPGENVSFVMKVEFPLPCLHDLLSRIMPARQA